MRIVDEERVAPPIEVASSTNRITLKQFAPTDAQAIFELIDSCRPHLSQFEDDTSKKYLTLQSVSNSILYPENPKRKRFGIWTSDEALVGSVNLTPDKGDSTSGEIGYYLAEAATGQGYAVEAVVTLVNYAFENLGFKELYASIAPKNLKSIAVVEKLGFEKTGVDEKTGDDIYTLVEPPI